MSSTSQTALPDTLGQAARAFAAGPHQLLIGSERAGAADGRTFATLDPATGREISEVALAGAEDVQRAVKAARTAFTQGPWSSLAAAGREKLMLGLAQLMEDHEQELGEIESLDNGKPVSLARRVDVRGAVATCAISRAGPRRSRARSSPSPCLDMRCYTRREAVGVCGQIIPGTSLC